MYFPATLEPHTDGSGRYDVTFCDLPGCITQGKDLDDALRMAAEALAGHIGEMLKAGEEVPQPSSLEEAQTMDLACAEEDGYQLEDGTLWQYIRCDPKPMKIRRKTAPVRKFQGCRGKHCRSDAG